MDHKEAFKPTGRLITVHSDNTVTIHGIEARGATLFAANSDYLVIKTRGFSANPGSPHSGLMSYYSPEIRVFKIVSFTSIGAGAFYEVEPVVGWDTGREKK